MAEYVKVAALCLIAVSAAVLAAVAVIRYVHSNKKSARLECKIAPDSKRIIWRIVNNGVRDLTVVEIGVTCADKRASFRPLYSANEEINALPQLLTRGDIASYRKELERFAFKPSEVDELKISNPYVYFYVKDAEGAVYKARSEYKFAQYLTMLMGGGK